MSKQEETAYLVELAEVMSKVEAILQECPEFDKNDLIHICFNLKLSPEERLRKALRRRVISGGTYILDKGA